MKFAFGVILLTFFAAGCSKDDSSTVASPDGSLSVTVTLNEAGEPHYSISKGDTPVLKSSRLGVKLQDANFATGLQLQDATDVQSVHDSYSMLTGKQREITYTANEKTFTLANATGRLVELVFRVSDDGVAFRYRFPGESNDVKVVEAELTSFAFDSAAEAWLQPIAEAQTGYANTNPSYEEHYQMQIPVGTPSSSKAGWVFPALFRTGDTWVLITEADMDGKYHASRLQAESPNGEYRIGVPMAAEVYTGGELMAQSTLPFESPWRIITVGSLATIVESTLGTDLAAPAIEMDAAFVKPGQASWSWAILKDDSVNYDTQKAFIDFAAEMDWEYTLVDADWDRNIGYERTAELAEYAQSKGVGLLVWYNSSGDWNTTAYTPKSALLTHEARVKEFSRLRDMGVKGIKVDFFAGDGQSMMQYYNDMLRDAADYELLVNFHGSSLPRGLQRTYPNMMTMESVRGFEYVTFFQDTADLAASHSAMLPFARNAFDPMDYTPTTFGDIPNIVRKTSNGFELAQQVIFLSGIQHVAEIPENMARVPDYVKTYMQQLPESWDETRFVQGFPGKLAVIARRAGERWFVSGINGENVQKDLLLDLSFISSKQGHIINDGSEQFSFSRSPVTAGPAVPVSVRGNGGFAMTFE